MNPRNFSAELKRRNVYKVAVAYAVVGWLIAQIATQIFPFLEIPNWIVRLVIVLIAIGFPIALVIAWAFEGTPEGIKRTEVADAIPTTTSRKRHDSPFEFAHETHESRQYKSKLAVCITIAITHPFLSHGALTRMG